MKLGLTKASVQSPTGWKISAGGRLCVQARAQPAPHVPALRLSWDAALDTGILGVARAAKYRWELVCWWQLLRSLAAGPDWGIRWVVGRERQQAANWGKNDEFHGSAGSSAPSCDRLQRWASVTPAAPLSPCTPRSPLCSSGLRFAIPPFSQLYCCPNTDLSYRMAETI